MDNEKRRNRGISKKYIIISSLTLFVSLTMLIFASVAWFTSEITGITSQTVVLDTDGIELDMALYKGNDIDRDGVLDNVVENGVNVDISTLTPEEIIAKQYTEVSYDDELFTGGCMPGVKMTYKLVIKNTNNFGAKLKGNFSKLDDYFEQAYKNIEVDENGNVFSYNGSVDLSGLNTLVGQNSARVMFELNNLAANEFTAAQFITVGEKGTAKTLSKNSYNLWEISDCQSFIDNVTVDSGDTIEINFVIECKQLQDIITGYTDYINNVYSVGKTADEIKEIKALSQFELSYVTNINITETSARDMYFTIKYLSVRGEQLGR